jgi:hypothetical protein
MVAVALAATARADDRAVEAAGVWTGCWESCENGHTGSLRANITQIDDAHYCARFRGTFFKVLPFSYEVIMKADRQGDAVVLEGAEDLGPLFGGVYTVHATVTGNEFHATYTSSQDHGLFTMRRCGCVCKVEACATP